MPLEIKKYQDAKSFLQGASKQLYEAEAINGLLLGLAESISKSNENFDSYHWFSIAEGKQIVLCAISNQINLVLGHGKINAIDTLASALKDRTIEPPGVIGPSELSDRFKDLWCELVGCSSQLKMNQRLYQLTEVKKPNSVEGKARLAELNDLSFLVSWTRGFYEDTLPAEMSSDEEFRKNLTKRIETQNLFLWEYKGKPVSMASLARPTLNGYSVNFVYTPREARNNGFASAVTAVASAEGLKRGKKFCVLYTDLMNPTSNSIYQKIGYTPITDSRNWAFQYISK